MLGMPMARARDIIANRLVGVVVLGLLVASYGGLYLLQHSAHVLQSRTTVRVDFRTTSGLRRGSPVQLAGLEAGNVSSVDFVHVEYACDPRTEDIGRRGEGRTDNCDETLFCSPLGLCADLERMTSLRDHNRCIASADCREDEVCITNDFAQRSRHVLWAGPEGVCVRYETRHVRVRVEMDVPDDLMALIRADSRAMVASNSVLGDQLVNISPGFGEPLDLGLRIQARRSLSEDIDHWRGRLDRATENIELSMEAVAEVFAQLNDPRWLGAVQGTAVNLQAITGMIMRRDGLVGALVSGPEFRRNVALMLRGIRSAAAGLSGIVGNLNRLLDAVGRNVDPILNETRGLSQAMRTMLADVRTTDNHSLVATLMDDRSEQLAVDLQALITETEAIAHALSGIGGSIANADGTVGKLLTDPKVASDLTRLLDRLEDHDALAAVVRWYLQISGTADLAATRDSGRPPQTRRR